jgi:2-phosphosulfolactate phosphatase
VELHVAFLPEEVGAHRGGTVVVIDVIRATTSLLVMIERGCAEVVIAPTVAVARRYREKHPEVLLAGEEDGRPPAGFDYGNSPVAFATAPLDGRRVVFATTNGTRAVRMAQDASVVLLGCLRNRSAAARAAVAAVGKDGRGVLLVCAGRGGRFSLEDAYTAGAIADAIVRLCGCGDLELTDSALAARMLYDGTADPAALFCQTRAGRHVIDIGLGDDLEYCAQQDASLMVPRVGDRLRVVGQ